MELFIGMCLTDKYTISPSLSYGNTIFKKDNLNYKEYILSWEHTKSMTSIEIVR